VVQSLPEGEHAVAVIRRIGEPVQSDLDVMHRLRRAGVRPGNAVQVTPSDGGVLVGAAREATELELDLAAHVFADKR
jgi:DtxR family Mn-dependent transcriptional regulator